MTKVPQNGNFAPFDMPLYVANEGWLSHMNGCSR